MSMAEYSLQGEGQVAMQGASYHKERHNASWASLGTGGNM